jgi:adenylylsulfate kinase
MKTVLWFTGLSGAGKSALAAALGEALEARGERVATIDGDDVRARLHRHLGFTPEDIRENNRLIAELAKERTKDYDVVLVPIISPFRDSRTAARKIIGDGFIELYVKSSEATRIARDPKGLYKKVRAGEIPHLIGYRGGPPYEEPEHPEIMVETDQASIDENVTSILRFLGSLEDGGDERRHSR